MVFVLNIQNAINPGNMKFLPMSIYFMLPEYLINSPINQFFFQLFTIFNNKTIIIINYGSWERDIELLVHLH